MVSWGEVLIENDTILGVMILHGSFPNNTQTLVL